MRIILIIFFLSYTTLAYASELIEGITPYGISVGELIKRYEDKNNTGYLQVTALTAFTHVFYSNALAIGMIRKANVNKVSSYYCESLAKKNPVDEIELFISWAKLFSDKDKSLLSRPLTIVFPIYLMSRYPLKDCPT